MFTVIDNRRKSPGLFDENDAGDLNRSLLVGTLSGIGWEYNIKYFEVTGSISIIVLKGLKKGSDKFPVDSLLHVPGANLIKISG